MLRLGRKAGSLTLCTWGLALGVGSPLHSCSVPSPCSHSPQKPSCMSAATCSCHFLFTFVHCLPSLCILIIAFSPCPFFVSQAIIIERAWGVRELAWEFCSCRRMADARGLLFRAEVKGRVVHPPQRLMLPLRACPWGCWSLSYRLWRQSCSVAPWASLCCSFLTDSSPPTGGLLDPVNLGI